MIQWKNYGPTAQRARKIDTFIARDLSNLPFRPDDPILTSLAQSNLLRGLSLRIPTGQAVFDVMGVTPLSPRELLDGEDPTIAEVLSSSHFHRRSPLWYYVLREAAVQQEGARLGEIGSRPVCETLIGLLKQDPNSYPNNRDDAAVTSAGSATDPGGGAVVDDLVSLLKTAGFTGI